MGEKKEPKPAPQNSTRQLPKVPENRTVHGENISTPRIKATR